MGTVAEIADTGRLRAALAEVRSDSSGLYRKSWVVVGHVNNDPMLIDVVQSDTSPDASLEGLRGQLLDDQVMYCLLRLTTTFDVSTTVKFVYIHWVGDKVPFAKKGRFGVVSGSIEQHFCPYHLLVETGSIDDLDENILIQRLEESSGTRNKVVEGSVEGRQERGFTAHAVKKQEKGSVRSVAPAGVVVETTQELQEAIADVRRDDQPSNWVLAGFEAGDVKRPLVVVAVGTGGIEEIKAQLDDSQVMFALYRTTDVYDEIQTVKFVYLYWIGERVKPLTKGKVSAYSGPVEKIFSPAHITMLFSNKHDIREEVIKDKVMASSGSKLCVK